jgi:UDP-N-acetyl-D-mannosaminuronic acid transferase (WecB/TagA/CpsF family)
MRPPPEVIGPNGELVSFSLVSEEDNMSTGESIYFLGSRFDTGSIEEAACDILAETHARFRYVVTPNVHHIVRLLEDPATMRPLYERAWRVFCDSRVLSRLARVSGLRSASDAGDTNTLFAETSRNCCG